MNRREARKAAFMLLFQYKFQPEKYQNETIGEVTEDYFTQNDPGNQKDYIKTTVEGTIANLDKIDCVLSEFVKGRIIERIPSVSLAAFRLCVYEMLYTDIPAVVCVNEAMNIIKEFEGEDALSFANGTLDNIKNNLETLKS